MVVGQWLNALTSQNYTTLPPVEFYAEFVVAHLKHSQFNETT